MERTGRDSIGDSQTSDEPGLDSLLHREVAKAALKQLRNGHYRDAALNSIIAAFSLLRARTGLDLDGADLANRAFSEHQPYLIVGDLSTEAGRNIQIGTMLLARGLFQAMRSPAAHSITQLDLIQAARIMVTASALTQVIEDAKEGSFLRLDGVYASTVLDNPGTEFFRFFSDGLALLVSITGLEDGAAPEWLTLDWAKWQGHSIGTYKRDGSRLECVMPVPGGEIQCDGQLRGSSFRMRYRSTSTGSAGEQEYRFRPFSSPTDTLDLR